MMNGLMLPASGLRIADKQSETADNLFGVIGNLNLLPRVPAPRVCPGPVA